MVREIITLSFGGCGIQFGQSVYKRYCNEYDIQPDGTLEQKNDNPSIHKFFHEAPFERYCGRNFFCDLDSDASDDIKQNGYLNLMPDGSNSIFGNEDGSNIFSRGYNSYTIQPFCDKLRMAVDNCDNIEGFMINHSITGSGAGLAAQMLEKLDCDYRKKAKIGFEICPIPTANKDCNVLNPYNMAMSMHKLIDFTEVSVMFDNKALYDIARNNLNIYSGTSSYNDLNEIIAKSIAEFTYPLRARDEHGDAYGRLQDLNGYQSYYVPFPRLHFLTPSMSPLRPKHHPITLIDGYAREAYGNSYAIYKDIRYLLYNSYCVNEYKSYNDTIQSVTEHVLDSQNFLMDYSGFDVEEDLYTSCFMHYKLYNNKNGYTHRDVKNLCHNLKRRGEKIKFVDWVPNGLDCSFYEPKTEKHKHKTDVVLDQDINCSMFSNNTHFMTWCDNRIIKPFNLLFDKRAYVHWFYNNGIEETDFLQAREDLFFLQKDYLDVLGEEDDSEYDYDENDYIISHFSEQQMVNQAIQNSLQ